MSGGLMQLVAYGASGRYLEGPYPPVIYSSVTKPRLCDSNVYAHPIVIIPPTDRACAICTCEANDESGEQWLVLTCEHKFHPACIRPWLAQNNTCPLCRRVQPH